MLPYLSLYCFLFRVVDNLHPYRAASGLTAALQNAHDRRLIFATSAGNLAGAFAGVHVPRLAADVRFVRLNLAGELVAERTRVHRVADAVIHKPCRFLGDSQVACNLATADAIRSEERRGGEEWRSRW